MATDIYGSCKKLDTIYARVMYIKAVLNVIYVLFHVLERLDV